MNIEKISKLIDVEKSNNAITIVYINKRYYFRFHFDENSQYIASRVDKLIVALNSKKIATKLFGLGLHGNNKYLWLQADEIKCSFYIAKQQGGLKGDEEEYIFNFNNEIYH